MQTSKQTRRTFLGGTTLAAATLPLAGRVGAATGPADDFQFEVTLTDEEWQERLSVTAYEILRKGNTEWPGSSPLSKDYSDGEFTCRGCDLHIYSSEHRVVLDKGWVFFKHAVPNAVLMDIDHEANYSMRPGGERTMIEAHCRRCGGHFGHILIVDGKLVHCINGAAMEFHPKTA